MTYWFDVMAEIKDRKYPEQMAYLQENHGFTRAHANALVLYSRGSTSSRRFASLDEYLTGESPERSETIRAIFDAITGRYPELETVIAWNQPMLKAGQDYIIGVSLAKNHVTIGPWGDSVIARFADRLENYETNKKTFRVPIGWSPDATLLQDIVASRLAEIES